MTFTKLALAALGAIGLTAGTVLAVAEPVPAPLPAAVAQVSQGKCPGSACFKAGCDTAQGTTAQCNAQHCPKTVAVSGKATECEACPAPPQQTEPVSADLVIEHDTIGGPIGPGYVMPAETSACETECTSKVAACEGKCAGRLMVGEAVNSNSGVVGVVVLTDDEQCHGESCSAKTAECNLTNDPTCPSASASKLAASKRAVAASIKRARFVSGRIQCTASCVGPGVGHQTESEGSCKAETCGVSACESKACDAETCTIQASTCNEDECRAAAKKHTRRLTLGFGFSSSGPILHVAAGPNDDSACEVSGQACCPTASFATQIVSSLFGNCAKTACSTKACDTTQPVAAIGCAAKPACASAPCALSACAASTCAASACTAGTCHVTNWDAESCQVGTAACDVCDDCSCVDCECGPCDDPAERGNTIRDPQASHEHNFNIAGRRITVRSVMPLTEQEGRDIASRVRPHGVFSWPVGDFPPLPIPTWAAPPVKWRTLEELECLGEQFRSSLEERLPAHVSHDDVPPVIQPGPHEHVRNYDSYRIASPHAAEAPGRVRVTHITPDNIHLPADVQYFPSTEFRPSPRIRLSSFAAPVAAPLPPAQPQPTRSLSPRLEGTWSRTIGDSDTSSFTHRNGRISGSWQVANGIEVRFSGSCTITKDDQFIGVIDEIEARGTGESFGAHVVAQRLVDQPFAARFVIDGDTLIIKDVRCGGISPTIKDEKQTSELFEAVRTFACGRFERSDE